MTFAVDERTRVALTVDDAEVDRVVADVVVRPRIAIGHVRHCTGDAGIRNMGHLLLDSSLNIALT